MNILTLYKAYREKVPWYADQRLQKYTLKLNTLRELYKYSKDETEKEKITKQAEELKTYIQALT